MGPDGNGAMFEAPKPLTGALYSVQEDVLQGLEAEAAARELGPAEAFSPLPQASRFTRFMDRVGDTAEHLSTPLKVTGAGIVAAAGLFAANALRGNEETAKAETPPTITDVRVSNSKSSRKLVGHSVKVIEVNKSGAAVLEVNSPSGMKAAEAHGCMTKPVGWTYWNTAYTSPEHTNANVRKWRQTVTQKDVQTGANVFCYDANGDLRKFKCKNLVPTEEEAKSIPTVYGKVVLVPHLKAVVMDTYRETLSGSVHAQAVCPDDSGTSAEASAKGSVYNQMSFRIEAYDVAKAQLVLRGRAAKVMGSVKVQEALKVKLVNDKDVRLQLSASASVHCGTPTTKTETVTVTTPGSTTVVTETVHTTTNHTTTTQTETKPPLTTTDCNINGGTGC
jgi:hypothetical protein